MTFSKNRHQYHSSYRKREYDKRKQWGFATLDKDTFDVCEVDPRGEGVCSMGKVRIMQADRDR